MSETQDHIKKRGQYHSIFWPLALITVGVLFLLNNLGVTRLDLWEMLAVYWPLIFVVGALDDLIRGKELPGSIISIGLGGMMVAGNLGYFPMGAWQVLFHFWPVFLLSIGLDLLFANRSLWINLVGVLLGLLVVAGMLLLGTGGIQPQAQTAQPLEVALDKATSAEVKLESPVGPVEISGGAGQGLLLGGTYTLLNSETLVKDYQVQNGKGLLELSVDGRHGFNFPRFSGVPSWKVQLNSTIPAAVSAEIAVGDTRVDLSGTKVHTLTVDQAVGLVTLNLDRSQPVDADLNMAVGRLVIRVPEGTPVVIRGGFAVTLVSLPDGWTRQEGVITSPGGANPSVEIAVDLPVGLVQIISIP